AVTRRSTASGRCDSAGARVGAAGARSPRRSSASCACAASIARSPPFTATYTSVGPQPDGTGQRGHAGARREHQVHAPREARAIAPPEIPETPRHTRDAEIRALADAGTGN